MSELSEKHLQMKEDFSRTMIHIADKLLPGKLHS